MNATPSLKHMSVRQPSGNDRVVKVTDLLDRPGASRRLDLSLEPPEDMPLTLAELVAPMRLAGVVESVVDGMLVRGRLSATVVLSCARCLARFRSDVAADVIELFSDPARVDADEDEIEAGYEIREGLLDLDTLLRDSLVPAVPYRPLCRSGCKGLCDRCGADLNEMTCDCAETGSDPRWAPLADLRLPDDT